MMFSLASQARGAFDQENWQYYRNVVGSEEGMVKVRLPNNISWSSDNLNDLRVVDDKGVETPYVVTEDIRPAVVAENAGIINSVTANDGSTKFVVDTNKAGVIKTSLDFVISKPDFRRQVSVYSSDVPLALEDSRWSLVTRDGYIFSFTDPATGSKQGKSVVSFSPNTARYFKVVISSGQEGAVVANAVRLAGGVSLSLPSYSEGYNANISDNPAKKLTEIVVDLGKENIFSNSITLSSKDTNYNRRVVVEASNGSTTESGWRYVGQSSISSIKTSLFSGVSNIVNYPTVRARYIKLSVVNDDNPAISIDNRIFVGGPLYEIVFEAKPLRYYKLYYGNPSAQKPRYDISSFASYIETAKLPTLALGEENTNGAYVPPKGEVVPFTEANKWLLNILLVVVVLCIGVGVAMYLRKYMKNNPKEQDQLLGNRLQKTEEIQPKQEE